MRDSDLVVPLAYEATAMRNTDTGGQQPTRSGAVSLPCSQGPRRGDVDSTNGRPTSRIPTMPGSRTSIPATRTTTTSATTTGFASSEDQSNLDHAEFSFRDLVVAHLDCRRQKRNTAACQEFERDLGANLWNLYERLISGEYRPGRSTVFIITWPKVREVCAASYEDRVVHHAIYLKLAPRFIRGFIQNNCACLPGRGTMYAAQRLEGMVRSVTENWRIPASYLKCDVSNFFPSISKPRLLAQITPKVPEPFWRDLVRTIIFHDPRTDMQINATAAELALVPPHKSLFHQPADRGLPIGNLTSQFFALIYLDVLDQYAKHVLRARYYIRYVDDFVVLDRSREWLNFVRADIEAYLPERLGIQLNPKKTVLQPAARGIDFVGQVIKPWHRRIRKRTANEALRRISEATEDDLYQTANSYLGLHRQATHGHGDRVAIARLLLKRGRAVDAAFTKSFRPNPQRTNRSHADDART